MCRRLCETYMVLGEVSLENENYPQACEDLDLCLKRRLDTLPADSRSIAETHYQLGIAQGFDMKYEEAVVSLEAAIAVLEARIANLQAETESPDDSKKDDASHTREKEAEELRALVPEIREKITDTNEMKDENIRKMKEAVGFTSSNGEESSSVVPKCFPVRDDPNVRKCRLIDI
jgi:tetratricopeptide (TPR) repeat protein